MFQFPRFPPPPVAGVPRLFIEAGCPIRRSPAELARQLTEAYRSLATSFFGFQHLGIHHAPVVAWTTSPLPPQTRVGYLRCTPYSFVNVLPACRRASPPKFSWAGKSGIKESQSQRSQPDDGRPSACTRPLFIAWLFDCQEQVFRQSHSFPGNLWWSRGDSNPRLPPCKGGALPTELRPHRFTVLWWAMVDSNHRPRSYQDRALTS